MTNRILSIRNIVTCILLSATLVSCKEKAIIPKETMAEIYYDMYMTDATISENRKMKKMADTLKVYEPIFKKYGYTSDDFKKSIDIYLLRPDKLKKIFESTQSKLNRRKAYLEAVLEAEGKQFIDWSLADSLEFYTMNGVHSSNIYRYMRVIFFKADTTAKVSPVPDSAIGSLTAHPLLLFADSAYNADANVRFYEMTGIQNEIKAILEMSEADTTDKPETENEEKPIEKIKIQPEPEPVPSRNLNIISRPNLRKSNAWRTDGNKDKSENSNKTTK